MEDDLNLLAPASPELGTAQPQLVLYIPTKSPVNRDNGGLLAGLAVNMSKLASWACQNLFVFYLFNVLLK